MSRRSEIQDEKDAEGREVKRQADSDKAYTDEANRVRNGLDYHPASDPVVSTDRWWWRVLNFFKRI